MFMAMREASDIFTQEKKLVCILTGSAVLWGFPLPVGTEVSFYYSGGFKMVLPGCPIRFSSRLQFIQHMQAVSHVHSFLDSQS